MGHKKSGLMAAHVRAMTGAEQREQSRPNRQSRSLNQAMPPHVQALIGGAPQVQQHPSPNGGTLAPHVQRAVARPGSAAVQQKAGLLHPSSNHSNHSTVQKARVSNVVQRAALEVRSTTFSSFSKEASSDGSIADVGIGRQQASAQGLKTTGVAGCLGVVMHLRGAQRGAVGHVFDHATNTQQSIQPAKTLINQMILGLGGDSSQLDLLLFNGSGLDDGNERQTGLIAWIRNKGWKSITDHSAYTTGVMTKSSFVLYYPQNGLAYIRE